MINQVTVEALHSANYVENYLDSVENLPDDVQRHLSRIREIDVLYRNHLRDVSIYYEQLNGANGTSQLNGGGSGVGGGGAGSDSSSTAAAPASGDQLSHATKRAMVRMQQGLIAAQELGDEKLQIVQHLQDLIDHKTRQLDQDYKNLGSDFFSRLDYGREEKLSEQKEIRTNSPGSACSPNNNNNNGNAVNNANSSPSSAPFSLSTGNGPSSGGTASAGGNGTGSAHNSSAGGGSGGYTSGGGGGANSNNGAGSGGNGSGGAGSGSGSGGGGGGSGSSGNGNGGSERGSKRARRTRNEQTGGSANNGSSTPNSTSGAMEVDPIDTSNIKQEVVGSSGTGQSSGNGGGGASGSGSSSGKASGSGSGGGGGGGGGGAGSGGAAGGSGSSGGAGGSGQGASGGAQGKKGGAAAGGKKKKRKTGGRGQAREAREDTPPPEETIDPDEPTYCLCDQISFGEMILCDNDLCPIEWFHFSCVALMSKPKGKWFCPNCRGDRPNVMKPKAQFLKELERYNKEKEEKT